MRIYSKCVSTWDVVKHCYVLDKSASTYKHWICIPIARLKESDAEKQQRQQLEAAQTQAAQSYYSTLPWQQDMAKQQMDLYNKQMTSQIGFQNQYMQQSQDQFNQYMALLNKSYTGQQGLQKQVTDAMSPYLSGNIGYTPEQMSALNTQGVSQIAGGYSDAEGALRAALLAHGETGDQPLSGNAVTNIAELEAGKANQFSSMRNSNLLSSYNQALVNKFNAANSIMGVSGQLGQDMGLGASGSNSALSGFGSMASRYATPPVAGMPGAPAMLAPPKPPGFWSGLMSSFSQGLGGGLSTFGLGGLSNMFSNWGQNNSNAGLSQMANAPLW